MAFRITALAKALTRRAALDDLQVTLTLAKYAARLLRVAARSPAESRLADTMGSMFEEAEFAIRWLSAGPRAPSAETGPTPADDDPT